MVLPWLRAVNYY